MSKYIRKRHNVSAIMYHIVCPAKYRKVVFNEGADEVLKDICLEISLRYEIEFIEIGVDKDHAHFLVQSVPTYSPAKIVKIIKSITGKEMYLRIPEIRKQLWGGEFWTKGYFISTVGKHGDEKMISNYVKNQGKEQYKKLHGQAVKVGQMSLWEQM